jgi:two-component system, NarL family, sensor histidine kinase UhpB
MKTLSSIYIRYSIIVFVLYLFISISISYFLPTLLHIDLTADYKKYLLIQTVLYILFTCTMLFFVIILFWKKMNPVINNSDEALHRFEALGNATNDAIWDYDMRTEKIFYNKRLLSIFGYSDEELKNNTKWWENNIHPADKQRVIGRMDELLAGKEITWEDEYQFRCKNGDYKIVYDRSYITRDSTGKPTRLIGAMKDISNLRALENELHQKQLQNKNLAGKEIIVGHELEKKKIKDELNEDVNQILVSIKFYISMIRKEYKNENVNIGMNHLDDAIKKINKISNNLFSSTFELLGLTEALEELFLLYRKEKNIQLCLTTNLFDKKLVDQTNSLHIYRIVEDRVGRIVEKINTKEINVMLANNLERTTLEILFQSDDEAVLSTLDDDSTDLKSKLEMFDNEMKVSNAANNLYTILITL